MQALAFLMLLPWFAVLGWIYWASNRELPRARGFDLAALALSVLCSVIAMWWSLAFATREFGGLWPQVLASLAAYGMFLLILGIAVWMRRRKRLG